MNGDLQVVDVVMQNESDFVIVVMVEIGSLSLFVSCYDGMFFRQDMECEEVI